LICRCESSVATRRASILQSSIVTERIIFLISESSRRQRQRPNAHPQQQHDIFRIRRHLAADTQAIPALPACESHYAKCGQSPAPRRKQRRYMFIAAVHGQRI
jgi:hypothetical protein